MKYLFPALFFFLSLSAFSQSRSYLLAGTYTQGKSKGIYVYEFNNADGSLRPVDSVATSNPSYLAVSPDQRFVYAVNENGQQNGGGKLTAFSFDKSSGHLTPMGMQSTQGDDPCYVALDKTGKWVVAGNYSSGSLSLFAADPRQGIGRLQTTVKHKGNGANTGRQEGPHVHQTVFSPDNKYLFVPDLGTDKLMIYGFNAAKGTLAAATQPFVKLPDGSGPRHFDFHPSGKWAYLVQELSGNITAFSYRQGKLKTLQTISGLPRDYKGPATSADIHVSPDGKFLYASNRDASNTLAIFKLDQKTGRLSLVGHQSTMGRTPRNFNFDPSGNYLLVANQNSDNIVVFRVDHRTGLLTDTGTRIDVGNPVCLKWITTK